MERYTYWNDKYGSFFLVGSRVNRWDLINRIGQLEDEIEKLKNKKDEEKEMSLVYYTVETRNTGTNWEWEELKNFSEHNKSLKFVMDLYSAQGNSDFRIIKNEIEKKEIALFEWEARDQSQAD